MSTASHDHLDLFDAPRDQLLIAIGAIGHEALPRDAVRRGQEVYATLRASLQNRICCDPHIRQLHEQQSGARSPELVAALTDLVASLVDIVPAATLAVLLIRDGLPMLCAEHWSE